MCAVTDQSMDVRSCNLIVSTRAIGTGKPLGRNPFGCAAPALALAPGRHVARGWRKCGRGRSLLTTGWAISGGTRLQETLSSSGEGGLVIVRPHLRPVPEQPEQKDVQHQADEEPIDQYIIPCHRVAKPSRSMQEG